MARVIIWYRFTIQRNLSKSSTSYGSSNISVNLTSGSSNPFFFSEDIEQQQIVKWSPKWVRQGNPKYSIFIEFNS